MAQSSTSVVLDEDLELHGADTASGRVAHVPSSVKTAGGRTGSMSDIFCEVGRRLRGASRCCRAVWQRHGLAGGSYTMCPRGCAAVGGRRTTWIWQECRVLVHGFLSRTVHEEVKEIVMSRSKSPTVSRVAHGDDRSELTFVPPFGRLGDRSPIARAGCSRRTYRERDSVEVTPHLARDNRSKEQLCPPLASTTLRSWATRGDRLAADSANLDTEFH